MSVTRPLKSDGVSITFQDLVASGNDIFYAVDIDGDLDTIFAAVDALTVGTMPPGSVGTSQLADGAVTLPKLAAGVLPTTLPPSGPAGGDLAGSTYPNPVLTTGSVTLGKLAPGVLPTTLPPSGAAGGDLAGSSYPNPVVAAGAITRAKTAADLWLPPPPAPANVGAVLGVIAGPALAYVAAAAGGIPEAPTDGTLYGRGGVTPAWTGVLPLAGGTLTGPLLLAANPTVALGAATKQYVDAAVGGGPVSPWIEDASAIYPNNLALPIGMGVATPLDPLAFVHIKQSVNVNGLGGMLQVEATNPSANQLVGLRFKGPHADMALGIYDWQQLFEITVGGTATSRGLELLVLESGLTSQGTALGQRLLQRPTDLNTVGLAVVPVVWTDYFERSGGANSTASFVLAALDCSTSARTYDQGRSYQVHTSGRIARGAGGVTMYLSFGGNNQLIPLFTWASGTVTWAVLQWDLDVQIVYRNQAFMFTACFTTTQDAAAFPAAAVAQTYLARGTASQFNSNNLRFELGGQFDTANAGNLLVADGTRILFD
jgi:hypothetical protein